MKESGKATDGKIKSPYVLWWEGVTEGVWPQKASKGITYEGRVGSVLRVVRYVLEYVRVREWVMYAQSRVGHWLRRGSNYLALRRRVGCRRQCHSCPDPSNLISLSSSITSRRIKSGRVQWATIGRSARIVIGPKLGSSRPQPIISLSPQEVLPPSASDGNCSPTRSFQTAGVELSRLSLSRDKNNPSDRLGSSLTLMTAFGVCFRALSLW
jgi:hypothetical protein